MLKIVITDSEEIACTKGVFWWRRIELGKEFFRLPNDIQLAALAHEQGHCYYRHIEKRILCLLLRPKEIYNLCKRQEIEADEFAAKLGHASALKEFLKNEFDGGDTHPSHETRRKSLEKYE